MGRQAAESNALNIRGRHRREISRQTWQITQRKNASLLHQIDKVSCLTKKKTTERKKRGETKENVLTSLSWTCQNSWNFWDIAIARLPSESFFSNILLLIKIRLFNVCLTWVGNDRKLFKRSSVRIERASFMKLDGEENEKDWKEPRQSHDISIHYELLCCLEDQVSWRSDKWSPR